VGMRNNNTSLFGHDPIYVVKQQVSRDANPAMTLPIKKRSNTEWFIDGMGFLYAEEGWIKDENVVRVVNHWCWLICGSSLPNGKSTKRCKNKKPGGSLFQNVLNVNGNACQKSY